MSLVSVVIPAFNARRWIGEALTSVSIQGLDDVQTIVVDDGSIDGTADYVSDRFHWVQLARQPNRGASVARNRGTELAQGRFIQYLDADDLLLPNALATRIRALEDNAADVAYSDWQRLVETGEGRFELGEVIARTIESVHPKPEIALFTDFWCPPVALMFTRQIIDQIGSWNERLPIIQDARFLLDAALYGGKFVHVAGVGGYYREYRGTSLSRRNSREFVYDVWTNATEVEEWWRKNSFIDDDRRQALLKVLGGVSRASFAHDSELFEKAFSALQRIDPKYIPGPYHLNLVAKLFGYRNAERLALIYRGIKRRLHLTDVTTASREWV